MFIFQFPLLGLYKDHTPDPFQLCYLSIPSFGLDPKIRMLLHQFMYLSIPSFGLALFTSSSPDVVLYVFQFPLLGLEKMKSTLSLGKYFFQFPLLGLG